MVDLIFRRRLILGVGAGYAPEEFTVFGVSMKERGSRLDEAVPLIHRLSTEDAVSHDGRHYRIGSAALRPRPVQRPRPPIWFAGWVEAALRRAGRLDERAGCVRIYREAMRTARRDAGSGERAHAGRVRHREPRTRALSRASPSSGRSRRRISGGPIPS